MENKVNRAEVLLENWKTEEQRLARFAEGNGSNYRELLRRRYVFLRSGVWRLAVGAQPHERANVQLLRGALSRMERQLWPNIVLRYWERLRAVLLVRPKMIKEFKEMKEDNVLELKDFCRIGDSGY